MSSGVAGITAQRQMQVVVWQNEGRCAMGTVNEQIPRTMQGGVVW